MDRSAAPMMAKLVLATMVRIAVECIASGDLRETSIFRPVAEVSWSNQPPDPRTYWPDHIGDFGPP
jgi:hypothetical protein